jgi:hypothetical protein
MLYQSLAIVGNPTKVVGVVSWREMGGADVGSGPWPMLPPQPTVSITGYVAAQFSFTAKAIPLETKASLIPRATHWRGCPPLGNA